MDDALYCMFCGRTIRNEYHFCPFCGVQCRDLPPELAEKAGEHDSHHCLSSRIAIHRLEEIASTLVTIEDELDHFIASKTP